MQRSNGGGAAAAACASCRHQRKKCTEKCALAPFFPVEKNQEFQAVHKLFGVSNVTKLVNGLTNMDDRKRAVESLVWEAMQRQKDPILGCYGEYRRMTEELKWYRSQYKAYKTAPTGLIGWHNNNSNSNNNAMSLVSSNGGAVLNNGATYSVINNNGGINMLSGSYPSYDNFSSAQIMDIKLTEESDNGSVILPQPHQPQPQQVLNRMNQQYYQLPGQYAKQLDWEGNS